MNQTPEQLARDAIDRMLTAAGCVLQTKQHHKSAAAASVALREYPHFCVFQVGLTATPDNRTFGYFNKNVLSDYGYEKAVIDGVLVPYNVFGIEAVL